MTPWCSYLEPICAVGHGVAGLCSSFADDSRKKWTFRGYSMTGVRPYVCDVLNRGEGCVCIQGAEPWSTHIP